MVASFDERVALMSVLFPCLMSDRRKVDLSPAFNVVSPETWAASSKIIGELSQHQDLVVFDIQTSKPFEVWLNIDKSQSDEVAGASV